MVFLFLAGAQAPGRQLESFHSALQYFRAGIWHNLDSSDGKASACSAGDPGSIPGWGRSPGEGNSNPLQCSCLENSLDRGAWWATVHGLTKSQTQLSEHASMYSMALSVRMILGPGKGPLRCTLGGDPLTWAPPEEIVGPQPAPWGRCSSTSGVSLTICLQDKAPVCGCTHASYVY